MDQGRDKRVFEDRLNALYEMLCIQQDNLVQYNKLIEVFGKNIVELRAESGINRMVASVIITELAQHDDNKLDYLIARAISRFEADAKSYDKTVRDAILNSIDELLEFIDLVKI